MTVAELAEATAGEDWAGASEKQKTQWVKEVSDVLAKGIPATEFAEKALTLFKNPPQPKAVPEPDAKARKPIVKGK